MPKDVKCWTKPKVDGGTYTTCVDKEGVQLRKKPQMNLAKRGKAKPKPAKKPTMPKVIPAKPRKPKKPVVFTVAKPKKPPKKPSFPTVIPAKPRVPKIPVVFNVGKPKKPPKKPSWPTVIPPRKPNPLIPKLIGVKERFKVWGISAQREIQEWWIQHDTRKEHSSTLGINPYGVGSHKWAHVYKKEKGGEPIAKVINWWDGIVKNVRDADAWGMSKDEEWKMYDSKRKAEIELDQMEEKPKEKKRKLIKFWWLREKELKNFWLEYVGQGKAEGGGSYKVYAREDGMAQAENEGRVGFFVGGGMKFIPKDKRQFQIDYNIKSKVSEIPIYPSKGEAEASLPKPEPKPKPKPEPTPKAPPASGGGGSAELEKILNPSKIGGDLLKYSKGEPVDFECYNRISFYLFLEVMRRNKNDCILGFDEIKIEGVYRGWGSDSGYFVSLEQIRTEELKQTLMKKYEECAKNNKIFCMPIFKSNHANMLVFNHHLNQLEYYEPHGTATAPFTNAVKKVVTYFNKNGASGSFAKKIKFSGSDDTCPNFSPEIIKEWNDMRIYIREQRKFDKKGKPQSLKSGLQVLEHRGTEEQQKQRGTTPSGKKFKDTGGYCCMWSFLHMDYRLKHPTLPPNQLATELTALARKNPREFFRNYIRGYTDDIFQTLIAKIGRENLRELNKRTRSAISAFNMIINQMYKDATGGKTLFRTQ